MVPLKPRRDAADLRSLRRSCQPGLTIDYLRLSLRGNLAALVGVVALGLLQGAPAPSFAKGVRYLAGMGPVVIQTNDMDADGNPDLVLASWDRNVWILFGKSDGSFLQPATAIAVDGDVKDVAIGDVNGDGKLDILAVAYRGPVILLLGKGDGTFQRPTSLGPTNAIGGALADLSGDGKLDLILTTAVAPGNCGISVYLGNGDGTFGAVKTLLRLQNAPYNIVVADFNNDKKPDLAVDTDDGTLCVALSRGNGNFEPVKTSFVGRAGASAQITAGEFSSDQNIDLAVGSRYGVSILRGNGDGSFTPLHFVEVASPYREVSDLGGLIPADFNSDGKTDLVGCALNFNVVLIGQGDGTFDTQVFLPETNAFSRTVVVADFNSDGRLDVAIAESVFNPTRGGVAVFLNDTSSVIDDEPKIVISRVVNAASMLPGLPVAPGELISIIGVGLGPSESVGFRLTEQGKVDTFLAGVRVLFDGTAAPLIAVSSGQIDAIVPYLMEGKDSATVQVEYRELVSPPVSVIVSPTSPGIFTATGIGVGQASAANEDGSRNSDDNPALKGSIITFYATGEGQTSPAGVDGLIPVAPPPVPIQGVVVGINNAGAEVVSVGAPLGIIPGLLQVSVRVPLDAPTGPKIPVAIKIGDAYSQEGTTISIKN